jgi:hypothetical protein
VSGVPGIYETEIRVLVLSRGPLDPDMTLSQIDAEMSDGDCIGTWEAVDANELDPDAVRDELRRMGNDGTFFDDEDSE